MRVYLKKRHIKKLLVVVAVVLILLALLKLVSWWDSKQGAVDPDTIQTTAPPSDDQTELPENSDPAPSEEEDIAQSDRVEQPAETEYEKQTDALIAEVYALRDGYVAELEAMYAEAEAALTDLAKQEDNAEAIASLVSSYLSKASDLEVQCDEQIDEIVAELEPLVRDNNGDLTLVDTLIETYATEKATKKAWYIERLEEKGLIS